MAGRTRSAVAALVCAAAVIWFAVGVAGAGARSGGAPALTSVPAPNAKAPGVVVPNVLSPQLTEVPVAQGATRLENPSGAVAFYGYLDNGPMVPLPGTTAEAQKTEPDKNTYLTLRGQRGADPGFDYGTHFLFQGHEAGSPGSITRVNLDADAAHRVTLLATTDAAGQALPDFDGSTWDPWAGRLLFTAENVNTGGVWQATLDVPSSVRDISGALGRGGYEGIQNDSDGNLWIVEDVGGAAGTTNPHAKQPNSFLYRFLPSDRSDLTQGGRLQALQVLSARTGDPITFHAGQADADITSNDTRDLHTPGHLLRTRWVTPHDTATDGTAPFSANTLAKAAGATPFKRPENGVFRPGSRFRAFFFTETGDTDARTEAGADLGGFGGIQVLHQSSPSAATGTLQLFVQGDLDHTGFDNIQFATRDQLAVVEDRGDTLHTQHNALDSGWQYDVSAGPVRPGAPPPIRFLAEGRDPSATIDSGLSDAKAPGFTNDGDNEITGIHVSDGDPTTGGILGAKDPRPLTGPGSPWRIFWTQQHGDNVTYEIVPRP